MPTLRVFFLDLIAFVPEPDGLWVLLPEAREGGRRDDGTIIEKHFPVVLFNTGVRNGSDWSTVKDQLNLNSDDRFGTIWALEREEIRISSGLRSIAGIELASQGASGRLPSPTDKADVFWIPRVEEVSTKAAFINPACLSSPVRTKKIVARMHFSSGRLRTVRFAGRQRDDRPPEVAPFEFRADEEAQAVGPVRAIADAAVLEINAADEVVIESIPFGNQKKKRRRPPLVLGPRGGTIDLLIGNLSPISPQDNFISGPHFELYYGIADRKIAKRNIPFLVDLDSVVARDVSDILPDFVDEVVDFRPGGFNRQICTFARYRRRRP